MFKGQVQEILNAKNKAMAVFAETKRRYEKTTEKAKTFIDKNLNEINKKEQEILQKKDLNTSLEEQIVLMSASIDQINLILEPKKIETTSSVILDEEKTLE